MVRAPARRPLRPAMGCVAVLLATALAAFGPRAEAASDDEELGRAVYNFRCYVCHGYAGDARTLAARFLTPPPRDFTRLAPTAVSRSAMIDTVARGAARTAMKPFAGILSPREIAAVVDYVRREFMQGRGAGTRYHTAANGWPAHERYAAAFPFAQGEIPLDAPPDSLNASQQAGRRLFLASCIACHDRGSVIDETVVWERQALSYPRFGASPAHPQPPPDAVSGATPYAVHDVPRHIEGLTRREREGEGLFLANCAFCHAADGTGRNWIGQFLQPHARDLTDPAVMTSMTRARLRHVIREGLPGTSMPAWGHALDAAQVDALIAYIARAFHPLAAEAPPDRCDVSAPAARP